MSEDKKKLKLGQDKEVVNPTIHVFDTYTNCDKKGNKTLCGEYANSDFEYQKGCDCLEHMRTRLAKIANDSINNNVCGNCVRHLYSNGLDETGEYESCKKKIK